MFIDKIIETNPKPPIYTPGTDIMWTDPHISRQLLEVHLNGDLDLASRKTGTIKKTVEWILEQTNKDKLSILDLGCGPGLYTSELAGRGHHVTGVDFSENSILYAEKTARKRGQKINYINTSYLDIDLPENTFDLIIMIYTDFGVLSPKERDTLLKSIRIGLKPGGLFIFDVLNDRDWETKVPPQSWECSDSGFWSPAPYLLLSDCLVYEEEKVFLSRHRLLNREGRMKNYHFWTRFFSHEDLQDLLVSRGFREPVFSEAVLPGDDMYSGDNVTFVCTGT